LPISTDLALQYYSDCVGQIDEEHEFGKGKVDVNGLAARGTMATGFPEWVMTKVRVSVANWPSDLKRNTCS
jgi:hypothetical protein